VNFALTLSLVVLAAFALINLLLSGVVAIACRAGVGRTLVASRDLLVVRLLPVAGAGLVALTVVLPAFLTNEPSRELEAAGPVLVGLALLALLLLGDGARRGYRAWVAAQRFLQEIGSVGRRSAREVGHVEILDVADPIVAVVGGWRPRIVAARRVLDECSPEEFAQVVAHESAHVGARDNLKRLLLVASPDPLAWLSAGGALMDRWGAAVEFEADECATGPDPRRRVALAAALIKVARLSSGPARPRPALSMAIVADDVEGRVRRLLAPGPAACGPARIRGLVALVVLLPVASIPLHGLVQDLIELLVAFGR
jgi:hypothetical protein